MTPIFRTLLPGLAALSLLGACLEAEAPAAQGGDGPFVTEVLPQIVIQFGGAITETDANGVETITGFWDGAATVLPVEVSRRDGSALTEADTDAARAAAEAACVAAGTPGLLPEAAAIMLNDGADGPVTTLRFEGCSVPPG